MVDPGGNFKGGGTRGGWGGFNIEDVAYFTHRGFPSQLPLPGQILHAVIQPGE